MQIFPDLDRGLERCEDGLLAANHIAVSGGPDVAALLAEVVPDAGPIRDILHELEPIGFVRGDYLIHQSDEPEHMFLIVSGQVTAQIEMPGRAPMRLETMRARHVVGELGFYLGTRRTAAVVADEPGSAYRLSRHKLEDLEQVNPAMASTLHRLIVHLLGYCVIHLIKAVDALQG